MPKRASRPWERRGIGRGDESDSDDSSACCRDPVPKITVDGIDYSSDRFYLHRPAEMTESPGYMAECTCGARTPPPLLDRGRLVASLQLEAAIVATYTLEPDWMVQEFPSLFAEGSVPTLVLHGTKGLVMRTEEAQAALPVQYGSSDVMEAPISEALPDAVISESQAMKKREGDAVFVDDYSDEEQTSTELFSGTSEQVKSGNAKAEAVLSLSSVSGNAVVKQEIEEPPPEEGWLNTSTYKTRGRSMSAFNACVYFTEILTTWLPPIKSDALSSAPSMQSPAKPSSRGTEAADCTSVDPSIVNRRKRKLGVHHPKYMILFEKGGSVVVVVSTGNLTKPRSTDGSWVQRFGPAQSPPKVTSEMRQNGSDFGHVLANFLQFQSNAAREGQMIPEAFLKKHLGMASIDDLRSRYKFEDAQAHLIATVPGEYPGRHSSTHLGKTSGSSRSFLYGPQRVADILHRSGPEYKWKGKSDKKKQPWLPTHILSDQEDRLIMQTTSFGGNWTRSNFAELVRAYGGNDDLQQQSARKRQSDDDMLERTDILWPTGEFMQSFVPDFRGDAQRKSPDSVAGIINGQNSSGSNENPSFIFLSSRSFNSIDLPCISRMSMFEPSFPQQMPVLLPPHIKTFGRLFGGNEYILRKKYKVKKAEELFSWVMLTSACLSRGAQGMADVSRGFESDEITYSNFELGVMFVSRLQGHRNDRLYCWNPTQCMCGRQPTEGATMIHLPVPYCLRPQPYQSDPHDATMRSTPYFHEITENTGFVGQMTLTPLGAALAASRK